uniref:Uncharacterized protein n=1 Tax=Sus scrofa TaxID=9823 RepID=A0A8D1Y5N4_PIG
SQSEACPPSSQPRRSGPVPGHWLHTPGWTTTTTVTSGGRPAPQTPPWPWLSWKGLLGLGGPRAPHISDATRSPPCGVRGGRGRLGGGWHTYKLEHVPVKDVVVGEALAVEQVPEELPQVRVVRLVIKAQGTAEVQVRGELGCKTRETQGNQLWPDRGPHGVCQQDP